VSCGGGGDQKLFRGAGAEAGMHLADAPGHGRCGRVGEVGRMCFQDLGDDFFDRRDPEREARRLVHQLQQLGYSVTLATAAS
jgi:hypothetical protein